MKKETAILLAKTTEMLREQLEKEVRGIDGIDMATEEQKKLISYAEQIIEMAEEEIKEEKEEEKDEKWIRRPGKHEVGGYEVFIDPAGDCIASICETCKGTGKIMEDCCFCSDEKAKMIVKYPDDTPDTPPTFYCGKCAI